MRLSIIIPTRNRTLDLEVALASISRQTRLPEEIIIVDDSDNTHTKHLVNRLVGPFSEIKIRLKYAQNQIERSIPAARNTGVKMADADIILFLDDDVILSEVFIEEIFKVYRSHPDAKGVQGYILKEGLPRLLNSVYRCFCLSCEKKDVWIILGSGEEIWPYPLTRTITCQRLAGADQSYRREVFRKCAFDEKLKKYAFVEDLDFSYRVHKTYPNSLFVTPLAQLTHRVSPARAHLTKNQLHICKQFTELTFFTNALIRLSATKYFLLGVDLGGW